MNYSNAKNSINSNKMTNKLPMIKKSVVGMKPDMDKFIDTFKNALGIKQKNVPQIDLF